MGVTLDPSFFHLFLPYLHLRGICIQFLKSSYYYIIIFCIVNMHFMKM